MTADGNGGDAGDAAQVVRWGLVLVALLHLVHVWAVVDRGLPREPFYSAVGPGGFLFVTGLAAVMVALVVLPLGTRQDASAWAGAGLVLALLAGFLMALPTVLEGPYRGFDDDLVFMTLFHALWAAGFAVPPFLSASAPSADRRSLLLQVAGVFLALGAAFPFLLADAAIQGGFLHALPLDGFRWRGNTWGFVLPQVLGELALVAGMVWTAATVDASWSPRFELQRATPMRVVLPLGLFLLAFAWAWGGTFMVLPVWPLPLLLLAAPLLEHALSPPFEVDAPRIVLAVLLVVGLVPVGWGGACTAHHWTDVAGEDTVEPATVRVMELAGHGPWWRSGGGFGGTNVDCALWVDALAFLWLGGVAGASWWVGRRAGDTDPAAPSPA